MLLKTLGGLSLHPGDFSRPKPLLLLAYLAVEGAKDKRHLYELFWPDATDPANSLRSVGKLFRTAGAELLNIDERTVSTSVESDIAALQAAISNQDAEKASRLYQGAFLDEFSLPDWGAELEEWVYSTREFIASQVCGALIRLAETQAAKGEFTDAGRWAEKAYVLAEDDLEPEDLERLYALLVAGNNHLSNQAKKRAAEYGLELNLVQEEAKSRYFIPPLEGDIETQSIPHNLPRAKTSFIGRDTELVELGQLITQDEVQLITLLGPGGVGKTRLALQLAHSQLKEGHFPDGVYLIALEALNKPEQVPLALAQSLGLKVKGDPLAVVKASIGRKYMLLF